MDKEVLVYVDLESAPHLVGRLWARTRKDRESATFEYDKNWLAHPERFSLEPALKLGPGPFHAPSACFQNIIKTKRGNYVLSSDCIVSWAEMLKDAVRLCEGTRTYL
jgi:serine/threonine-protein kinase HipA